MPLVGGTWYLYLVQVEVTLIYDPFDAIGEPCVGIYIIYTPVLMYELECFSTPVRPARSTFVQNCTVSFAQVGHYRGDVGHFL
jgi:hypothetical protein